MSNIRYVKLTATIAILVTSAPSFGDESRDHTHLRFLKAVAVRLKGVRIYADRVAITCKQQEDSEPNPQHFKSLEQAEAEYRAQLRRQPETAEAQQDKQFQLQALAYWIGLKRKQRTECINTFLNGYGKVPTDEEIQRQIKDLTAKIADEYPPPENDAPASRTSGVKDSSPHLVTTAEPEYTQEARRAKISGVVYLSIVIDPDGVPTDIHILRSLDPGLDQKAIEAVQKWRFIPAVKAGHTVPTKAQVTVSFKLLP